MFSGSFNRFSFNWIRDSTSNHWLLSLLWFHGIFLTDDCCCLMIILLKVYGKMKKNEFLTMKRNTNDESPDSARPAARSISHQQWILLFAVFTIQIKYILHIDIYSMKNTMSNALNANCEKYSEYLSKKMGLFFSKISDCSGHGQTIFWPFSIVCIVGI